MTETTERATAFAQTGDLQDAPLPLLLARIFQAGLQGMLHIEGDQRKTWIYFSAGRPAGVHFAQSEIYLGMILREMQIIDDAVFNQSLMKMAETNKLQGQVLLEMGAVTEAQLDQALEVQQLRKISQLFDVQCGTYRFEPGAELPERMVAHPIHPYPVIYNGIRNRYTDEELDRHLAPLAGKHCRASPRLTEEKQLFGASDEDAEDLALLAAHPCVDAFSRAAKTGPTAAKMWLLTLYWCDLLEVGEPVAAPQPAPAPAEAAPSAPVAASVPPAAAKAERGQREHSMARARVRLKLEQAEQGDLLALLEIPLDATAEQIKRSYAALTKSYHPDLVARFGDADLSQCMAAVATSLNQAYDTLSDPQKRADYLNERIGGGKRPISLNPEAGGVAYQKAKVYMQKKNLPMALESLRLAIRLDPAKATYQAQALWVEYESDPDKGADRQQRLFVALKQLFDKAPGNFWVNRHLATVAGQLGRAEDLELHLSKAHRIQPAHIATARELRLLQMRQSKDSGGEKTGGLFGLKRK